MFLTTVSIYKIECLKNGYVYIGKSSRPESRKRTHLYTLRKGKHPVEQMQSDFDKYGEDAFVFTVLEEVKREAILCEDGQWRFMDSLREKETMLQYKSFLPEFGYNYKDQYFHPTWGKHRTFRHTHDYVSNDSI